MRLVDANIRATPPMLTKNVRHDVKAAHDLEPDVVNWQELGKFFRYKRVLRQVFGERYRHLFMDTRSPISVDTRIWKVIDHDSIQLTPPAGWIPQPERRSNFVVLENRRTGKTFADVNSHFTNGAFNRKHLRTRRARLDRWETEYDLTKELVRQLLAEDHIVFGSGDYNSVNLPKLHPNQQWLIQAGIMKMWYVAPGPKQKVNVRGQLVIEKAELKTDHPIIMSHVWLPKDAS